MIDKFYDFCKERDEEWIDNRYWYTCAVGLFLEEQGVEVGRFLCPHLDTPEFYEQLINIEIEVEDGGEDVSNLYDALDDGLCKTFGHIARLIENSKHRGGKL